MFSVLRTRRAAALRSLPRRQFHPAPVVQARSRQDEFPVDEDDLDSPTEELTSVEQLYIGQHRRLLYYMRLIEHELPQLVAFRKPFIPPPPSQPLVIRSISYGGEEHPATVKRTVVVPVSRLPLENESAIHKFKLLAGVRWSPEPPKDSGIGQSEVEAYGRDGYFKMSCEDLPQPAQNLRRISDILSRLINESNRFDKPFDDVPVDTRHLVAKARKAGKGEYVRGRAKRPSVKDFPKEWLPDAPVNPFPPSSTQ